jgi:pSer/pThr/pTyr-binding forkhead associated (FHA) protein
LRSPNSSLNRQDARDSESGRPTSLDTHLVLEICRGRTEQPLRPVQSPRFLIGSSPRCDLRVGSAEIPPLFALIFVDGSDIWLESMAATPALRVNGRAETSVRIADGDRIGIGSIELVAHVPAASLAAVPVADNLEMSFEDEADAPAASDLSARELVERIEAATELVNEFEERQRLGIEALHSAVEGRLQRPASASPEIEVSGDTLLPIAGAIRQPEGRPLVELESLVIQLSGVVAELEKRSGAESRREAEYLDAVSTLFETQDRLSRQLEILLRRVAFLNADRSSDREPGRAIA